MPRDTLTRDQIVRAAIDLLDADGLEGLSMRALGRRLDSAATAVYWHVGSKDNLIALAGDQVWNEIELPDLAVVDWRTAATQMATGLHTMLIAHPWLIEAFGSFLLSSTGKARHDDHTLAVYEAAGFTGTQADQSAAVFTYVLGNALGPAATATASLTRKLDRDGGTADEKMLDHMAKASQIAAQFPRLQARFDQAADYAAAPDHTFEFGLHALLDGLEAQLTARHPQNTIAP
ncbi:TetR/AcrR family transcriptional regulator C-terminal domain-containing protein [Spirillospora sp. NPDC029432]|uniref:TetR/AcrR family transcriptional regulator n=1 Tax=Spirillospora sp. NPDC029432 TaxID=3154599 RepID=UPI003453A303